MSLDMTRGKIVFKSLPSFVVLPNMGLNISFLQSGNMIFPIEYGDIHSMDLTFGEKILTFGDEVLEF